MKTSSVLGAALALLLCLTAAASHAEYRLVTIGTGAVSGVYYAAGSAICRLTDKGRASHGLRCSAASTGGSVYNLNTLRAGELDFGVVQSDVQFNALKGLGQFREHGPMGELRALFSLHAEPLTLVARADAGVTRLEDLRGKRFNVGNPGSGHRATLDLLLPALGLRLGEFAQASELKPDEHGAALCERRIDGFAFVVGHPAANIREVTSNCGARLLPIAGPAVEQLIAQHPYYALATIPGGLYPGNPEPVSTFGVVASLVTTTRTPPDVVYALVKAVFDNLDEFRRQHPAFAGLRAEEMIRRGMSAPLHEGALRYYRERGWL